ncbi:50S ribosomal protein L19 [candidate division TA06 bacterium DG_26]|uniref:Large ribosomal subunit protein bL19 n=1 Tax=candidate division TA06 bacterium DG_26 TaxID=1703771 RepID=A0A0S7WJR2_UNCT6|nr:MAG: 50S ribosomal protein L19 [candidate division TA06 bacterium DG_26]
MEKEEGKERALPAFKPGDTVTVYTKIREGEKERVQPFQGVVIQERGAGISRTFTVRRIAGRYGVERIYPLHSPNIVRVKVTRKGKVRRAKLFYLRGRTGKKAKVKEGER